MPLSCSWSPWPIEAIWDLLSWSKGVGTCVRISSNKLSPWSNQKEWKRRKNYSVIPCHSVSCTMLTFTLGTLLYFILFCFCLFFLFVCCCFFVFCFIVVIVIGNSALNISDWKVTWSCSLMWLPCAQMSLYMNIHRVTTPQRTTLQKSTYSPTFFITTKDFNSAIHRPYFKFLTIISISHLP